MFQDNSLAENYEFTQQVALRTTTLSFMQNIALDKHHALSEAELETLHAVNEALCHADEIVICLGGKSGRLGECIVGTGFLEGTLRALSYLGKVKIPVTIIVDEHVVELFDEKLYRQKYWPRITILKGSPDQSQNLSLLMACRLKGCNIFIMDFHGANDDAPYLQVLDEHFLSEDRTTILRTVRVTTLAHLFRVGMRSYANRGPHRRYADFIEDLLNLPAGSVDGDLAQPTILLSSEDEARYADLAMGLALRPEALLVICFFQSVVIAKCYPRWDEVLALLADYFAQHFPLQKIDFLVACGPDEQQPEGLKKADLEEDYGLSLGANNAARLLVRAIPSLRDLALIVKHALLVLSNDTGPGHISGALQVPTVVPYLPGNVYAKKVWSSTLWHHGVTVDANMFDSQQLKAAVLWNRTAIIRSISPESLMQEVRKILSPAL